MRILSLLICVAILSACKKDKETQTPEMLNNPPALSPGQVGLHYDDYNMDAPELQSGNYEVAARFSGTDTENLQNGRIVAVQLYLAEKPTSARLNFYKGDTISDSTLVYCGNILSQLNRLKWNVVQVDDTVLIDEQPLWIAFEFTASSTQKYIGCDPGPAHPQGDWMWSSLDQQWLRFENRTETSINWNIRGVVEP